MHHQRGDVSPEEFRKENEGLWLLKERQATHEDCKDADVMQGENQKI